MDRPYLILFLGADWWGSDARALAVKLRHGGHCVIDLNYEDYLPTSWSLFPLRLLRRLFRGLMARNYNHAVRRHANNPALDFILVCKGMLLAPETLGEFKRHRIPCYCFYPDVSFTDHGANITNCLPLYDCVFTTKRFHAADRHVGPVIQHVAHGFDPEVHRPLPISEKLQQHYACDVSFVGCWSPKKEGLITALIANQPNLSVKVWGPGWGRSNQNVRAAWQGRGAYGDELAIIYGASRINLGLLSEAGSDTREGDAVTARTWQIPAAGGFLLHELTTELAEYFQPGSEVGTFTDGTDLPSQVERYLANDAERKSIALAGYRRCLTSDYTYAAAAQRILEYHARDSNLQSPVKSNDTTQPAGDALVSNNE
jgi:spore maturation protein CgeB